LFNDPLNCGSCLNACSGGQSCVQGACGCPPGQSTCNGLCVDLKADTTNCGTCGTRCVVGQVCSNGSCTVSGAGGGGGASGSSGGSDPSGGTSAGGTSGGGAGGTDVVVPPERMGCAITPGLISDFEEGAAEPVLLKHENRTGEWEMYNDGSSTTQTLAVESSGGTEMCDKFALHVKGSGYGTWGAGFGFSLVDPPEAPKPYNATLNNFTGIRFKAKLGSTADMNSPVRMNISTPWTESAENPGGMCSPSAATTTKAAMDCYQHAGRFLPMGTGAGQLSTTFQTFTYCFDRDLYPLSLPSNLTAEQRNNIGTNMLKVQFQFNSGKDYRGSYPANGEYPEFGKALPFDFWIDDVEFISGECPNMPASPSNGSPAKPFPQNTNIGSCAPATNAAKFAGNLIEAYQHWTKTFVMNDRIVAPEQQNAVTSEAMGYGMMIAAAMGDKAAFDKFWGYVQTRLSGGLMIWKEGQSGSATDGDIDIAYALLMGHAQWPSGGYKTAADNMAAALLNQSTGDVASNVLRGGNTFRNSNFNPSYFIPAALAKFSGAGTVLSTNYSFVNTNVTSGTSGIPTDWGNPNDGKASGPGSAQVTSDITDGENGAMGYDAARVPWRLGQHACQDSTANKTALMAIVSLFAQKYDNGATIDLMKAGWLKTNGNPHTNAKDSQGSFIGPMGVAGMAAGNTAMRDRAFRTMLDILENGDFNHTYFPSTVGLITALIMSGNFPVP
jgi:endo-1,4-beta-D-glucanase Y